MSKRSSAHIGLSLLVAFFVVGSVPRAYADPADPQSTNYSFKESVIGVGGMNQSSSTSYQAEGGTGDIGVGNSGSTNFQVNSGSKTTHDPTLSFIVNSAAAFTDFTASAGTATTSTFTVSNYTSYGYVVDIVGSPPSSSGHTITAMATTGASTPGTEQFGINLVANTSPFSVGANPNHGQFGFGDPTTDYGTPNQYRYVSGETIAVGPKTSGDTTYTITYLVNVKPLTPGGKYTTDQTLIVTGTY